ncbi:MAG: hypothetical protein AABY22_11295 [Nanoarchaeota archaeon]
MTCKHIWFKEWSTGDYNKYYCMRCLKEIRKGQSKNIIIMKEGNLLDEIKKKFNWEENTSGLTFQDLKRALKYLEEDLD